MGPIDTGWLQLHCTIASLRWEDNRRLYLVKRISQPNRKYSLSLTRFTLHASRNTLHANRPPSHFATNCHE
jgi:hypothetical protein